MCVYSWTLTSVYCMFNRNLQVPVTGTRSSSINMDLSINFWPLQELHYTVLFLLKSTMHFSFFLKWGRFKQLFSCNSGVTNICPCNRATNIFPWDRVMDILSCNWATYIFLRNRATEIFFCTMVTGSQGRIYIFCNKITNIYICSRATDICSHN